MVSHLGEASDVPERLIRSAEQNHAEQIRAELFFREFALHLAKQATRDFGRRPDHVVDGAEAVSTFIGHEQEKGRLKPGEITTQGRGYQVSAKVHSCPYQQTCVTNLHDLGEVPQCVRAITLIQAIGTRIPHRPPMTYDLQPGLVDKRSGHCDILLRPAALKDIEPIRR